MIEIKRILCSCGISSNASRRRAFSLNPCSWRRPTCTARSLAQADIQKSDLIVIGSHGRSGFERLLLGSITEKVLRKATCPVMVVPPCAGDAAPSGAVHFSRILCPVDFSGSSLTALTYATSLAEEADAHLTALHVVEIPAGLYEASATFDVAEFRMAAEAASRKRLYELIPDSVRTYCEVETVVSEGRTSREILRLAAEQKSDLIVMGTGVVPRI